MSAHFKLVDETTGEEISLPAKRKCWDGCEIEIVEFKPKGKHGLIRTAMNEVYVPSVCGAKIIEFPPTPEDILAASGAIRI